MPGSDEQYDLVQVKDQSSNSKSDTFFVAPRHVGRDGAGTERVVLAEVDEPTTPPPGNQYLFLASDGVLKAKFSDGTVTPIGGEAGAPDDAEYVTLSSNGDLTAEALHASLTGADLHDPSNHALGGAFHTADTLANVNTKVSDATLDDQADPRDPTLHSPTHQTGGTDQLNVGGLSGDLADAQDPKTHSLTHENGGGDELNVGGLSGDLADAQDPKAHESTHRAGGLDPIDVNTLVNADTKADLTAAGGVLVASQLPDLAITNIDVVADETERLNLDAEEGDVAVQTDISETFILSTNDPTVDANWKQIQIDVLGAIEGQQILPAQVGSATSPTVLAASSADFTGTVDLNTNNLVNVADIAAQSASVGDFSTSGPLQLATLTADPAATVGELWYRSDLD